MTTAEHPYAVRQRETHADLERIRQATRRLVAASRVRCEQSHRALAVPYIDLRYSYTYF